MPTESNKYYSGQGRCFIGDSELEGLRKVGNVPALVISLSVETLEHKESHSGQRLTDKRLQIGKTANVTITLENFKKENLALALYGTVDEEAASSAVDEAFTDDSPVVNYVYPLDHQQVSNVVVEDSAGTPATLIEDTDYEVNYEHGSIEILNLGSYVAPFTASYDYAAVSRVGMFAETPPERFMRFEGLNTAETDEPVLVELYKVKLDPLAELGLITDEITQLELTGTALLDSSRSVSADLSQFGRAVFIPAAS